MLFLDDDCRTIVDCVFDKSLGRIQSGVDGNTSLLVPELKRYYVAASEHQDMQSQKFTEEKS